MALAVNMEGQKELPGLWIAKTEGSKFWLKVLTELKNRAAFPSDEAAIKRLYLALLNISRKWTMPIRNWKAALSRLAIVFEGRVPIF